MSESEATPIGKPRAFENSLLQFDLMIKYRILGVSFVEHHIVIGKYTITLLMYDTENGRIEGSVFCE